MQSHRAIWDAIDAAAARHGFSVSGLARLAGLDATAFNKSKRVGKDGRERWPSTESIAKVLDAVGESYEQFLSRGGVLMPAPVPNTAVPLLGLAQAGAGGYFDGAGFPVGEGWDQVQLPLPGDSATYALEVSGDSMVPLYREGDIIIVSPTEARRRGDRVVVRTRDGEVMVKILARETDKTLELHSVNPDYPPRRLDMQDIDWIARIVWARQ